MADVFDQIHTQTQQSAPPPRGGDVFDQIHAEQNAAAPKGFLDQLADYPKGILENLAQTGQSMVNLVTTDPRETIKGIGAAQDALRLKAVDAFKKGDYVSAGRHALEYLIPMAGPQISESGDLAQRGEVGRALGQATSMGLQAAGPGALHANAPAIVPTLENAPAAIKNAAQTAGTAVKGAAMGGAAAATEMVPFRRYGVGISLPKPIVSGAATAAAGRLMGLPPEVGAVVGAAGPVVKGAISGAKAALADRIAAGFEARQAAARAAAPLAVQPAGLLGPGAITPEAPPDASYVRSVPAEYPQPEAPPPKGLLNTGPNLITPEAPPDPSFVRSVPAEYPQPEGAPTAPAAAAPAPEAGLLEGIAQGQLGKSFSKATQAEQQLIRNIASRLDQPVPEEQAAPAVRSARPPEAPVEEQPTGPGRTIDQVLRDELAARRAAAPPEPAAQPATAPQAAPATAPAEEPAPQLESPRSQFNAAGERKSPQLRGEEIKAGNADLKAQRFAEALHGYAKSSELQLIPKGRVDPAAIAKGAVPGWGNITDQLVAKGLLESDEVPPNSSIPGIISKLKGLEAAATKGKLTGAPKAAAPAAPPTPAQVQAEPVAPPPPAVEPPPTVQEQPPSPPAVTAGTKPPNALRAAVEKRASVVAGNKAKLTPKSKTPQPETNFPPITEKADSVNFAKERSQNGRKEFTVAGVKADGTPAGEFVTVKQDGGLWSVERKYYKTPPGPENRYGQQETQVIAKQYPKADAKQIAEAFLKGEPHPFADVEAGQPMSKYVPVKKPQAAFEDGLMHGKVDGVDTWSNGHVAFKSEPPAALSESTNQPIMQREFDRRLTREASPVGFFRKAGTTNVVLSDGTLLDAKYYDYAKKAYPNAVFKVGSRRDGPVAVYSGDEKVGLVMPIRPPEGGVPPAIQKLLPAAPEQ